MDRNNIARERVVSMRLRYGRGHIQRDQQYFHARGGYQRRAQGAKRAVSVRGGRFNRHHRVGRCVRGAYGAECNDVAAHQRARERRRCRQQRCKGHRTERDHSCNFFAAAAEHGAIIIPPHAKAQVRSVWCASRQKCISARCSPNRPRCSRLCTRWHYQNPAPTRDAPRGIRRTPTLWFQPPPSRAPSLTSLHNCKYLFLLFFLSAAAFAHEVGSGRLWYV